MTVLFLAASRATAQPLPLVTMVLAGGLCVAAPASAQVVPSSVAAPSSTTDLGNIEIRAQRDNTVEQRREATAGKIVIGREEIDKQGDATIADVLKRLPGVTLGGAPGRGGAIRMRGLGSGYTQILLDGERVPPGFSIEQLTPEQVERIEIMRAPTAETGARAMAGTINIVLREGRRASPDDLKLTASSEHGYASGQAQWVHNLQSQAINGSLTLSAMDTRRADDTVTVTDSTALAQRVRTSLGLGERRALNANARLQWKGEQGRSLTLTPFVVYSEHASHAYNTVTSAAGFSDAASSQSDSRFVMARLNGQWAQPLSADDRLEVRFGAGQSTYDYNMTQSGAAQTVSDSGYAMLRNGAETQSFVDRSANVTGKWTRVLESGHQIVSGLEFEQTRRSEEGNAALAEDGGSLAARTRRWALYTQDEFKINPQWSAHAGLRYESVLTQSTQAGELISNRSGVWTPLLHAVFKPDPRKRDQWRMSLTRSYKSPSLYQLVALYRPALGENTWTQPDRTGNPHLRPELATGIDIAYERYLAQGGVLSAGIFRRNISDLIRYTTTYDGSRYVSSPTNVGDATTQGVELEAKFRLDQWLDGAWPVDVRSNVSFFHSRVKDVPGPNNRLDQQPSSTGNLGADYRLRGWPLTVGGNFNWNPAYDTRRSDSQWAHQGAKRVLDVYALWRISPAAGLRLTVSNLTPLDYVSGSTFSTNGQTESSRSSSRNWRNVQLRLELKI